jgi:hypothetical protein
MDILFDYLKENIRSDTLILVQSWCRASYMKLLLSCYCFSTDQGILCGIFYILADWSRKTHANIYIYYGGTKGPVKCSVFWIED